MVGSLKLQGVVLTDYELMSNSEHTCNDKDDKKHYYYSGLVLGLAISHRLNMLKFPSIG